MNDEALLLIAILACQSTKKRLNTYQVASAKKTTSLLYEKVVQLIADEDLTESQRIQFLLMVAAHSSKEMSTNYIEELLDRSIRLIDLIND